MTRILLLFVFALFPPVVSAAQALKPALEEEVAKIDAVTADPNHKMIALEVLAHRLGTHRNRLLLLRRQTGESYGDIFVSQLKAAGRTPEEIQSELSAVNREVRKLLSQERLARGRGTGSTAPRPILYLGTGLNHNSTGTFYTLVPEIGIDSKHVTLVAGVPYYKNSGTNLSAGGIGDVYASGLLRGRVGHYELGANLVVGFPTGDNSQGLGAGKVTVDASGLLQRRFERIRPFVKAGVANFIFNNVGYQRPYISTGNAAHVSGGIDFRAHRRLVLGGGGFAVRPWGVQDVQSRTYMEMEMEMPGMRGVGSTPGAQTPGTGMPGMGWPGMGTPGFGGGMTGGAASPAPAAAMNTPFYERSGQSVAPAEDLRDHGAVAWASVMLRPGITLNFSVARSIPFKLTTVGVSFGFDLAQVFFPGKRL